MLILWEFVYCYHLMLFISFSNRKGHDPIFHTIESEFLFASDCIPLLLRVINFCNKPLWLDYLAVFWFLLKSFPVFSKFFITTWCMPSITQGYSVEIQFYSVAKVWWNSNLLPSTEGIYSNVNKHGSWKITTKTFLFILYRMYILYFSSLTRWVVLKNLRKNTCVDGYRFSHDCN